MKKSRLLGAARTCLLLLVPMSAHATLVTFGDGTPVSPLGYTEAGMTITSASPSSFLEIRDWQSYASGQDPNTNIGEREFLSLDGATYTFSLVSGGTFDLLGLDIESPVGTGSDWAAFGTFDVIGSDGASVTLNATSFGTQSFGTTFTGLTSFTLEYDISAQATFDNINFTAVPVPAAAWLFGSGLLGLIGISRRKKSA